MNTYFSIMDENKNNLETKSGEEKFYDFIEAAAHDLQAPLRKLSVLVGRVFTKNPNNFDDNGREYIDRIESCIDEMKLLINGMVELAKTDARMVTDETCDLDKIARDAFEKTCDGIAGTQVSFYSDPLPVVHGDPIQYQRLFRNLFENAVKFRRENSNLKIDIRAVVVDDEERENLQLTGSKYHKIEISDNGIGFSAANDKKIFEPFIRLHSKSQYAGNGLGLFICKKIAANHNGIIYAEGNEKHGARIILILPETP
ncbi:MAG TPA: ATP-binding protein [Chitinophagaceae bacterium]|nr:ATP-binding protein [Chitinophagaceae bacterium]